jgi:MGT family glycosyltransferase
MEQDEETMKFLFCCLASPGYVNPAIGIALQMQKRGHSVAFVTDIAFHEQLQEMGLQRIPRGAEDGPSFQVDQWFYAPAAAMQMKHVNYAIQQFKPDVLIGYQLTFGPILMSEVRHIPIAILGFFSYLWPGTDLNPAQLGPHPAAAHRKIWRYTEMLKSYNEVRALLNLPASSADWSETPLLGDLFMLRNVAELEAGIDNLPDKVHLVGDCLWENYAADPEIETWLEEARAENSTVVYVHHGRVFNSPSFWPKMVEAMAGRNVRIAAAIGRMDEKPSDVPSNFLLRPYLPQGHILRRANAMIASANTTAVLGALTMGVPSVLIPSGGEEPEVADQCQAAGVAKILPDKASSAQIAEALQQVLEDDNMLAAAKRAAAAFARMDSMNVVANLLESLAETKKPVLRSGELEDARRAAV